MAERLASIFGTEKDKVNCSFYFKIGACRHGDKCARVHNRPTFSQTILLKNIYLQQFNTTSNSKVSSSGGNGRNESAFRNDTDNQHEFDDFYEELWVEISEKYGEIEEMKVCDNLGEHLVGNCYIKFRREDDAAKAVKELNNRWFDGKPIYAELSPVTDFREACCRQYDLGECTRGGFCNFMHLKHISKTLSKRLFKEQNYRYEDSEHSSRHDGYSRERHRHHNDEGYRSHDHPRDSSNRRHRRHRSPTADENSERHHHRSHQNGNYRRRRRHD
ncbi:hypothetical protein SNEBB_000472 [Seison nebaliae]|nr:hypothetical protein SNEBB_000472 [Seison nebaliae]